MKTIFKVLAITFIALVGFSFFACKEGEEEGTSDGGSRETAIRLTLDTWADGNISTSGGVQWFKFTATRYTQYIHVSFGTLHELYVQVYDSRGAEVGSETFLYNSSTNKYISQSVTSEQTYYIRIRPYSNDYKGTYRIGFTMGVVLPGVIPLTENTWTDGNIPTSSGEQLFYFTATASTQYIHVDLGTLKYLFVQVYDSSDNAGINLTYSFQPNTSKYISRSVTSGQTYYIRVRPDSGSGTYKIGFNTGAAPPGVIPLTENTWADGNIPILRGEQWFSFTATASTQYIHPDFGTLHELYVQVYDSSDTAVGDEAYLSSSNTNKYISLSVIPDQVYYIKIRTYTNSGTYKIGFTTSTSVPTL